MENVIASNYAVQEVAVENLEIRENVVNILASSSKEEEVAFENLEICVGGLNESNQVFPDAQTDSHIGVRVEVHIFLEYIVIVWSNV